MADLDFTHNVSQVPQGEPLPTSYRRNISPEITQAPDMQSAINNYADSTNWLSSIGSTVATKASNAIATRLGSELGQKPQGNLSIPLTNFDKAMQESYETQSHAVLGVQANKLITDSNIEMSSLPRLTPSVIDKTNKTVSDGLQKIFNQAPSSVKTQLEYQYKNIQINQNYNLIERMTREQKEDRRSNSDLANQNNAQNAYSLSLHGNDQAALSLLETTKKLNDADVAAKIIDPKNAKANVESVRKSYLTGKIINEYEKARSSGKSEDFLKSIADKKPSYLSDEDYMGVTNNLMAYVNHQDSLRNKDENLMMAKFKTSIAMNPVSSDMSQQLQNLKEKLPAEKYEEAKLSYINAVKKYSVDQQATNNVLASWNDPSSFSRIPEKSINKAFDLQVTQYVNQREKEGSPISKDEAEVQVAASAGGNIPVFEKTLQNKILSGNPNSILSASNQMEMLDRMEQGRVYAGVSQKAKAIATLFQQQRGSMPDTDLARKITDSISNIDDKMQKTLDNSWDLIVSTKGAHGLGSTKPLYQFALEEIGVQDNKKYSKLGGKYFAVIYGNDIYNQLNSNFIATRGDYDAAVKMTKDYVSQHYGETYVNGEKQFTDSPIEKYLGFPGNDITPYIHQDMINQLNKSFMQSKEHSPNDYWEVLPLKNNVVEVARTIKTKDGDKKYKYPVNLVGRNDGQWDVVVQTPYGQRNLFLVSPNLGVTTYTPNKEEIQKNFKPNKHKGWFGG